MFPENGVCIPSRDNSDLGCPTYLVSRWTALWRSASIPFLAGVWMAFSSTGMFQYSCRFNSCCRMRRYTQHHRDRAGPAVPTDQFSSAAAAALAPIRLSSWSPAQEGVQVSGAVIGGGPHVSIIFRCAYSSLRGKRQLLSGNLRLPCLNVALPFDRRRRTQGCGIAPSVRLFPRKITTSTPIVSHTGQPQRSHGRRRRSSR